MQSIWQYLETLPVWEHIAIAFAKRLALVRSEKIYRWREHRIDNQVVAYLVRERELHPAIGPHAYG